MLEKSHYFPGQESREEIILFLRRHWVAYFKWIIILALLIIVPSVLFIFGLSSGDLVINESNDFFFLIIITIYILFILALFITTWIDYYLDVTIVTREHLVNIKQNELFSRSVAEQSLLRVQDVSSKKVGFFQTYFNFGTVLVETAGEMPNFTMHNIEDPNLVARTIMNIQEELLQRHELEGTLGEELGMETLGRRPKSQTNNTDEVAKSPLELIDIVDKETAQKEFNVNKKQQIVDMEKLFEDKGEDNVITVQDREETRKKNKPVDVSDVVKIDTTSAPEPEHSSSKNTSSKINTAQKSEDKKASQKTEGELKEGEEIKL